MELTSTSLRDRVLRAIKDNNLFAQIRRLAYTDPRYYNIDAALSAVDAIGKARSPRFVIDADNRFVYENFLRWVHGDTSLQALDPQTGNVIPGRLTAGIYIAGPTGSGKSWCLDIMQAYCRAQHFRLQFPYDDKERELTWATVRADGITDHYLTSGEIDCYKRIQILGIQDLGNEPQECLYMGNRVDPLRQLIEYRGDLDNELTLITSNLRMVGDKTQARYGDRAVSRLQTMCNYYEMRGADRRRTPQR